MRDYHKREAGIAIAIVNRIVIDVGQTTVIGVATNEPVSALK